MTNPPKPKILYKAYSERDFLYVKKGMSQFLEAYHVRLEGAMSLEASGSEHNGIIDIIPGENSRFHGVHPVEGSKLGKLISCDSNSNRSQVSVQIEDVKYGVHFGDRKIKISDKAEESKEE